MKLTKLSPNLAVADIRQTVAFYSQHLGFELLMAVPDTQDAVHQQLDADSQYVFAILKKDTIELAFQRTDTLRHDIPFDLPATVGGTFTLYFDVSDIDSLHQTLHASCLYPSPITQTWYGARECYLQDPNGYVLGFAQSPSS